MRKLRLAVCVAMIAAAPLAHGAIVTFNNVIMTGSQEVPPVATAGIGNATVIVDDVLDTVFVSLTYSGLSTPAVNAHIHCCAPPGVNAAVMIPFIPGGFVTGSTSGSFSHLFTGISPSIISGIEAWQSYVNIHTDLNPGGEIRGNLTPEPGTIALFGLGLGAVTLLRRRRS